MVPATESVEKTDAIHDAHQHHGVGFGFVRHSDYRDSNIRALTDRELLTIAQNMAANGSDPLQMAEINVTAANELARRQLRADDHDEILRCLYFTREGELFEKYTRKGLRELSEAEIAVSAS